MTVIAMTREMGSLGKDVALGISVELGLAVVHHELVERELAERLQMHESEVHRFLEGQSSLLERWKIDQKRLSCFTAEEILQLAQKDNVLIRGWGASHLLKNVEHVVRVRVCAAMGFRVRNIMDRMGLSDEAVARREIERNDAAHTRVMRSFFDVDWESPLNYHMVLNTGALGVETCIDQLRGLVQNPAFEATEASRGVLSDRIVEARVRSTLDDSDASASHSRTFDIKVEDGGVTLSGAAMSQAEVDGIVALIGAVDGVREVETDIVYVAPVPMV